jgi:hypothetical protein
MNDALLMSVLDGVADLDEQVEPFLDWQVILIAIIGDPNLWVANS